MTYAVGLFGVSLLWYFLQYMTAAHPARNGIHRGEVTANATHIPNKKTPAMTNATATVAKEMTKPFKMMGRAKNRARMLAPTMIYLIVLLIGVVS